MMPTPIRSIKLMTAPPKAPPALGALTPGTLAAAERLLRRLAEGPMDQLEVAHFLAFSPSGGRKYTRLLVSHGVVRTLHGGDASGSRRFQVDSLELALAWLAHARAQSANGRRRGVRRDGGRSTQRGAALPDGVHLIADDIPFRPKRLPDGPARRDPLVAALFGEAGLGTPRAPAADEQPDPAPAPSAPPPGPWHGGRIDWSAA
jgi:hypothetical protein